MVVSVIFGIYIVFFESPRQPTALNTAGDRELEDAQHLYHQGCRKTQSGPSKEQAYILNKAQSCLEAGPFNSA